MSAFGSIATLGIDIIARMDKLDTGFKRAENKAQKAGKNIEKAIGGRGLSGVTQTALKAFSAFSLLEVGIKSLTIGTELFKGNWEEAATLVKQLPLGIGTLAQGMEGLLITTTSWGRALSRAREELRKTEEFTRLLDKRAAEAIRNRIRTETQGARAQSSFKKALLESELIGQSGFQAELIRAEQFADARIENLQSQLSKSVSEKETRSIKSAISQEERNRQLRRTDIGNRIAEILELRQADQKPEIREQGRSFDAPAFGRRLGRFEAIGVRTLAPLAAPPQETPPVIPQLDEKSKLDRERNQILLSILRGQNNSGVLK